MPNSSDIVGAWPPPPGVTPNFEYPDYVGYRVVIAALVAPAIVIPFVLVRSYTKRYIFNRFELDDYCVIAALLCALVYSILQVVQTENGSGRHIWDVPLPAFERYIKFGIGGAVTYNLSTLFTKASILLFYLRLTVAPHMKLVINLVLLVAVGYSICGAFAFTYLCQPMQRYWNFNIPGTCVNIGNAFLAGAALNVATDIAILLLPLWLLHPLRLPLRQKIGVTLILMTGSFVCAISIFRLAIIPSGLKDTDSTWRYVPNLIWCIVEMYTGIICSCLPSLKAFVKRHFPNLFESPKPVLNRDLAYGPLPVQGEILDPPTESNSWFRHRFQLMTTVKSDESGTTTDRSHQSSVPDQTYPRGPNGEQMAHTNSV